jgi:hypothetical protein
MSDESTGQAQARSDVPAEVAHGQGRGLGHLANRIPPSRGGRPVSPSTLTRWITHGVAGPSGRRVYLEAVRAGGRWVSTEAALARFLALLTPSRTDDPACNEPSTKLKPQRRPTRQDDQERARQELKRLGI